MMKTILVASFKGGQGKTTTAMALASILNAAEKKTLLIDADRQCNSTDTYHGVTEGEGTLYDVIVEGSSSLNDVIQHTENGDLVPGDAFLMEGDQRLLGDMNGFVRLSSALKQLEGYDYVVLDTAPDLDMITKNCIVAADYVVIPVTADRFAIQGFRTLTAQIQSAKEMLNPTVKIAGVLLVKYNDRSRMNVEAKAGFQAQAAEAGTSLFETEIRETVRVREAQAFRANLIDFAPSATATLDYIDFTKELLTRTGDLGKKDLQQTLERLENLKHKKG